MRLSDLRDKLVRSLDGERLGRIHEVHCERGKVTAIMVGPASYLERLTAKNKGRRIPWEMVRRVDAAAVTVSPDPPRRKPSKPSAARSRRRTRPPSGRRSGR
jgi:sporulation protein YlmC with PRC-barrel domain